MKWFCVEAGSEQQRGPMEENVVKKLFNRGILSKNTMLWREGMKEWMAVERVEPFRQYVQTMTKVWYWMLQTQQNGPVSTQDLVQLVLDAKVDGETLIWAEGLEKWTALGEVVELKEIIQEANCERDRQEEAFQVTKKFNESQQVYSTTEKELKSITAEDGTEYVYDNETREWLTPGQKIEEELLALAEQNKDSAPPEAKKKKKRKKNTNRWVSAKENTWIYVAGLPEDVTESEVVAVFSKCGVIQLDLHTGIERIKLYRNKETGKLNGDASICYMKVESIDLALQLLDGSDFRPGHAIKVSKAVFEQKGDKFVKQDRLRIDQKAKVRKMKQQQALSWNEGVDDPKGVKIVVFKGLFTLSDIQKESDFAVELRDELRIECSKYGKVDKVTVCDKHRDGVVLVKFASSGAAAVCQETMDGRFFGGSKISCSIWDGVDYTHKEDEHEIKKRDDSFGQWLEDVSSEEEEEAVDPNETHHGRILPESDEEGEN